MDAPMSVLVIVGDDASCQVVERVLTEDKLVVVRDLAAGLAHVRAQAPDVAFVDVTLGEGAGLAMVHHVKAMAPESTVFALTTPEALEIAANAIALGGAGLLMLPLSGDEVLSAMAGVKQLRAERGVRAELEAAASFHERAAGWIARVAELAEAPDRTTAARALVQVLIEATGAAGVAVYLPAAEGAGELVRCAATPDLENAPLFGVEMLVLEHARAERLLVVPLTLRKLAIGHLLLRAGARGDGDGDGDGDDHARVEALVRLLAAQATTALALLAERDRSSGGSIKDPKSSAYSFAYYVDVAGREIDRARRHGRRFAIATIALDAPANGVPPALAPGGLAEQVLKAVRDTDVVAHVDEQELQVLLPETDGLGAHACRRRILTRLAGSARTTLLPAGVLVGTATFPHDGRDLSQLLRIARRRAESSKASLVHRLAPEHASLAEILDALEWDDDIAHPAAAEPIAARAIELPLGDAAALAAAVVADAVRGGATLLAVAHHPSLSLGAAVRASVPPGRDNVTVHLVDASIAPQCEGVEAFSVIAEHGAYAFIARNHGGVLRGVHAADPLLADLLAERLGRAGGLRVFP
jgi:ActR/RegA family two-component response regulator